MYGCAPDAHAVICLAGLMADGREDAMDVNGAAFAAAAAIAATYEAQGGLFVTVQDTGGDFGLADESRRTCLAGWAVRPGQDGGARVANGRGAQRLTWPANTTAAAVAAEAAARLAQELLNGGADLEIGLPADGRRLALYRSKRPLPAGAASWRRTPCWSSPAAAAG